MRSYTTCFCGWRKITTRQQHHHTLVVNWSKPMWWHLCFVRRLWHGIRWSWNYIHTFWKWLVHCIINGTPWCIMKCGGIPRDSLWLVHYIMKVKIADSPWLVHYIMSGAASLGLHSDWCITLWMWRLHPDWCITLWMWQLPWGFTLVGALHYECGSFTGTSPWLVHYIMNVEASVGLHPDCCITLWMWQLPWGFTLIAALHYECGGFPGTSPWFVHYIMNVAASVGLHPDWCIKLWMWQLPWGFTLIGALHYECGSFPGTSPWLVHYIMNVAASLGLHPDWCITLWMWLVSCCYRSVCWCTWPTTHTQRRRCCIWNGWCWMCTNSLSVFQCAAISCAGSSELLVVTSRWKRLKSL